MPSLRTSCGSLVALLAALCACLGASAAPAAARPAVAPKLKLVKAPPSSTHSRQALFRFKVSPAKARTWCKLDDRPYRKCRDSMRYRRLRAERHTFAVRAKHGRRTSTMRHHWQVMPATKAPPAPPVTPPPAVPPPAVPPPAVPPPVALPPATATNPSTAPSYNATPELFAEDFNGTAVNRASWALYDSPGHDGRGLRRPSALSLDGQGNLVVTATWQDGQLVSGAMAHRVNYTYGRFAFRVRAEPDPTGTMSGNVLTWPREQWAPEFTESDMWETGWHPNNTYRFNTFIHFGTQNWQHWFVHAKDPSQWHIVEMDWRPERLAIYVDGEFAWETTDRPAIPDVAHHICIQLDPEANRPLAHPVRMFVDWVRIYA